jgi:hypothetical protein
VSTVHFRDKLPFPSGICGAGWQNGKDDNGNDVRAVRSEERVDCPKCLRSLHPGYVVARHGKVTALFRPDELTGMVKLRLRAADDSEVETEVPLLHLLGTTVKVIQEVSNIGADVLLAAAVS